MLAVNEITSNAIQHGSPAAVLRLRSDGRGVLAQVTDEGRWPALRGLPGGADGSRGLPLARRLCEQVTIDPGPQGTTVTLWMRGAPPRRDCGPGLARPVTSGQDDNSVRP